MRLRCRCCSIRNTGSPTSSAVSPSWSSAAHSLVGRGWLLAEVVMPPDEQEIFVHQIVTSVVALMRAVYRDDALSVTAELARLVSAIIKHRDAMAERPDDAPLRRAIARM